MDFRAVKKTSEPKILYQIGRRSWVQVSKTTKLIQILQKSFFYYLSFSLSNIIFTLNSRICLYNFENDLHYC